MSNLFFISDLHLGHDNVLKFTLPDGSLMRPHWDNVEAMAEDIKKRWNSVVSPDDKVYVVGDVIWRRQWLPFLDELNGSKRLIMGNHDMFDAQDYLKYFKKLYGVKIVEEFIVTHVPVEADDIRHCNIHGHRHANSLSDARYFNVSVEAINYTPIEINEIRNRVKAAKEFELNDEDF